MNNKEFFRALNDLERDKGISKEVVLDAFKTAMVSACKKENIAESGEFDMVINEEKGSIEFFKVLHIVDEIEDCNTQITLEEAKEKKYKAVDNTIYIPFNPVNFSRIAVQNAKSVILQKLRETERNATISEFTDKEGELMMGTIKKIDPKNIYVEIASKSGSIEGIMGVGDQVKIDEYKLGDVIKVLVKKVKSNSKGAQVLVSRSSPLLVKKLFEEEIPELRAGLVKIMGVSRDAGQRSKIAIKSEDSRVDPVGACIGNGGSRVNIISKELKGEKIDIVPWSEDPLEFIVNALSPAKVISVTETGEKSAVAIVPDDKLSLAIGKDGQNAKLAVRLTGWKIDVKNRSSAEKLGLNK